MSNDDHIHVFEIEDLPRRGNGYRLGLRGVDGPVNGKALTIQMEGPEVEGDGKVTSTGCHGQLPINARVRVRAGEFLIAVVLR